MPQEINDHYIHTNPCWRVGDNNVYYNVSIARGKRVCTSPSVGTNELSCYQHLECCSGTWARKPLHAQYYGWHQQFPKNQTILPQKWKVVIDHIEENLFWGAKYNAQCPRLQVVDHVCVNLKNVMFSVSQKVLGSGKGPKMA